MTRVKICGIQSVAEARLAQAAGADAIGLLVGQVHSAGDFIDVRTAAMIAERVGPFLSVVLVTHVQDEQFFLSVVDDLRCDAVQLHSDFKADRLLHLREQLHPRRLIGKISVVDESAVERALEIQSWVDAIVLDSFDAETDRVGGTGQVHDWTISRRIRDACATPVILAGGLRPDNVAAAIRAVSPAAVDVNSGVEFLDGAKSEERMCQFVEAVRQT